MITLIFKCQTMLRGIDIQFHPLCRIAKNQIWMQIVYLTEVEPKRKREKENSKQHWIS